MQLTINGAVHQVGEGTTLIELLTAHTRSTEAVAVAVDGEVVHRQRWAHRVLADGQAVELITAMQGG